MKIELNEKSSEKLFKLLLTENSANISNDEELIKQTVEHLKKGYDRDNYTFIEEKYTQRNLKSTVPLEILRIMIMVMMKKLRELNTELTLYDIGYEFGKHINPKNYDDLKKFFKKNNLGTLVIHSRKPYIIKVKDCALCAGLTDEEPICYFDAGVFAGAFECILGKVVVVDEIKCMAKGDDACYFKIMPAYDKK